MPSEQTRLQKGLFVVAGVRRQGPGVSQNKDLWIRFIAELFISRLFAGRSEELVDPGIRYHQDKKV